MAESGAHKIKYAIIYVLYLVGVWTAYRLSGVILSLEVDEFLVKPAIWLIPIFFLVHKEKGWVANLGITTKNLLPGIYLALIIGVIFAIEAFFISYLKYGVFATVDLNKPEFIYPLLVSVATAFSEEIAFRGFLFNRILGFFKNEILANLITSIFWVIIRMPAAFVLLGYNFQSAAGFWLLTLLYSVGAGFIFAKTRNIFAAVLLYVLWETAIILFR